MKDPLMKILVIPALLFTASFAPNAGFADEGFHGFKPQDFAIASIESAALPLGQEALSRYAADLINEQSSNLFYSDPKAALTVGIEDQFADARSVLDGMGGTRRDISQMIYIEGAEAVSFTDGEAFVFPATMMEAY